MKTISRYCFVKFFGILKKDFGTRSNYLFGYRMKDLIRFYLSFVISFNCANPQKNYLKVVEENFSCSAYKTSEVLKKILLKMLLIFVTKGRNVRRYYIYSRSIEENSVIIEISLDIAQRNDSRRKSMRPRTILSPWLTNTRKCVYKLLLQKLFPYL